jgi:hypothetical protein
MKRGQTREEASTGYQPHGKAVRKHERRITATILPEIPHALPQAILTPSRPIERFAEE